jgi:uncharacterized protein (DUF1800 family)
MPASTQQIAHLLRRTGVRVNMTRLAELQQLELSAAVDAVCDFSVNPALVLPAQTDGDWKWGEAVRNQYFDRLANLPNPLEAKLVLFWHGHFATALGKVGNYPLMVRQYQTIARLAAGNFENLAQAIALDPAMMLYLDNNSNTKRSPNENFARELMELFTLGVNRGYTQSDVREAARAWTGFGVRWPDNAPPEYEFHPTQHDTGIKTLFGITKAWTGPQMITEMCVGSRQRFTAEFLVGKLWAFFAYENPDASLIASLADDYVAEGLHTLNFLRRMFKRAEFYSDRALQGRVKSPIEWGAWLIGSAGITAADVNMGYQTTTAGHEFFNPPNVAGWKNNRVWMNETVVWVMDSIASYVAWRAVEDKDLNPASRQFFASLPAMTPVAAVSAVEQQFGLFLSASSRQAIETWLTNLREQNGWGQVPTLVRLMAMTTEARLA